MKTIKKKDLVKKLSKRTGISLKESEELTKNILEIISKKLVHENVKIANFGTFKVLNKKERMGRNPKTKEEFKIKARKVVSFYPSKKFKDQVSD